MKTILKIMAASLLLVLVGCGDDSVTAPETPKEPSISFGPAELMAAPKETIKLVVSVENVDAFFAADLELIYDDSKMDLVDVLIPEGSVLGSPDEVLLFKQETQTGISVGLGKTGSQESAGRSVSGVLLEVQLRCRKEGEFSVLLAGIKAVDENGEEINSGVAMGNSEVMISCR